MVKSYFHSFLTGQSDISVVCLLFRVVVLFVCLFVSVYYSWAVEDYIKCELSGRGLQVWAEWWMFFLAFKHFLKTTTLLHYSYIYTCHVLLLLCDCIHVESTTASIMDLVTFQKGAPPTKQPRGSAMALFGLVNSCRNENSTNQTAELCVGHSLCL